MIPYKKLVLSLRRDRAPREELELTGKSTTSPFWLQCIWLYWTSLRTDNNKSWEKNINVKRRESQNIIISRAVRFLSSFFSQSSRIVLVSVSQNMSLNTLQKTYELLIWAHTFCIVRRFHRQNTRISGAVLANYGSSTT